jgi:uncharacterized protein
MIKRILHMADNPITGTIVLWGIFCVLYFPLHLLFISDILSGNYRFIYKVHSVFAMLSHCIFISSLCAIAFITFLSKRKASIRVLIFAIVTILAYSVTMIDIAVFKINHFHINSFIISEITQPNFFKASGVGYAFVFKFIAQILSLIMIIFVIGYLIQKIKKPILSLKQTRKRLIYILLSVLLVEKLFIVAVAYNRPAYIFNLSEAVPVVYINPADYLYVAFNKLFGVEDKKESFDALPSNFDNIEYPKGGSFPKGTIGKPLNVLIIVTESTRHDFLTSETMPNVWKLAHSEGGSLLQTHYSGSNSTHMGIFSILYGMNPYFSAYVKTKRIESFPVHALRAAGYRTSLFASATTQWHHMDYYLEPNFDTSFTPKKESSKDRDMEITNQLKADLSKKSDKPFFTFVFFDSTHYPFFFPEEHALFTPYQKESFDKSDYLSLDKIRGKLMNSYRNSLHYADAMMNEIITALKKSGQYNNTIIIITSDHGCEFGETGRYFYSSSFNNYSTKVPLVIHAPGGEKLSANVSSHADIFPTVLDLVKFSGDRSNMQGTSLLGKNDDRYGIIAYQDALIPNRFQIVNDRAKLEVNFKDASFITARFDSNDTAITMIPDERKRLDIIKASISFFNKKETVK